MQRVISAILLSIATFIFILVIVMQIVKGESIGYRFYLLLVSGIAFIRFAWYQYFRNRTKKEIQVRDKNNNAA